MITFKGGWDKLCSHNTHYNKVDFFLGSKPLKKVLKALITFKTNSLKTEIFTPFVTLEIEISNSLHDPQNKCFIFIKDWQPLKNLEGIKEQ